MATLVTEPPFHTVAIVGLGLIGGSIALAIRERWPSIRVVGVDREPVLAHALGSGAIDQAVPALAALPEVELVVLAAPVRQNVELLRQLAAGERRPLLVTDVGGTKRTIVEEARALPSTVRFVGGHPLGGAERGGFAFARADMFSGRPWILTPDGPGTGEDVATLSTLAAGLGARPTTMDAAEHDRLMAFLSHLPQLTASALMAVIGDAASADGLRLAGRGLIDTTRLAASPADVWRDICQSNADAIRTALDGLIARLTAMRDDLSDGDGIDETFQVAARWRATLMKGRD